LGTAANRADPDCHENSVAFLFPGNKDPIENLSRSGAGHYPIHAKNEAGGDRSDPDHSYNVFAAFR